MGSTERWNTKQAASFIGIPERRLSKLFALGLLPAIPIGNAHTQKLVGGIKRHRRVNKWVVPAKAFIKAWENYAAAPVTMKNNRRRRAA